jgi:hypothetical protein
MKSLVVKYILNTNKNLHLLFLLICINYGRGVIRIWIRCHIFNGREGMILHYGRQIDLNDSD